MKFLSAEWLVAMRSAAANADLPVDAETFPSLVLDQHVDDVSWRMTVRDGAVVISDVDAVEADVRLEMDRKAAVALATGARSVLDVFISGNLRVGGDLQTLLSQHRALATVEDLFAEVRAATDYS